ncbi:uncharacterized protein LOC134769456 [Penaeus indicus]|uniref:uncharacterized protein LOC134769456 n=1 Tax=Penaeus indicus TaxID=29960 RepID=UPI00300D1290
MEDVNNRELKEAQKRDQDIGPVVQWMEDAHHRPRGVTVVPMSLAITSMSGVAKRAPDQTDGRSKRWRGKWTQETCKMCDTCNAKKRPAKRGKAPLQLYQVGTPTEWITVDVAVPFPVAAAGNRFILVAMDFFSKWPEAYPIANHEAVTVAEVFSLFGAGELHSDQGREFETAVFQECYQLMGIRNHNHEATTFAPSRMMLGRELHLPLDLVTGKPPNEELPVATSDYAIELQQRLEEVNHQVCR